MGFDYINNSKVGLKKHQERMKFEQNMNSQNAQELKQKIYQKFAEIGKRAIIYANKEKGDVHKTEADVKEIEKKLNFKPKILLEEGLPLEIEWLKKIKNEYQEILK